MEPIRSLPFGSTRSRVTSHFALITPDTHVYSKRAGWENASAVVHISPEMGARFTQYTVELMANAVGAPPPPDIERFIFVLAGAVELSTDGGSHKLSEGQFAFLPADTQYRITTGKAAGTQIARLAVFEKRYQAGPAPAPPVKIGDVRDISSDIFQGDIALRLQTLLPAEPQYDLAVNVFTYDGGGFLPQVEVHVMEHGLLMLDGAGVYRLGDDWFPVQGGDVIWMASYCPQWFVAMGKSPTRYLYYKDIHRDHLL